MESFGYSPMLEIKARANSFTSNASWRSGKNKNEEEGTWDYVTYHRVPNKTKEEGTANIRKSADGTDNKQNETTAEGLKTELVVIEEDLMDDKKSSLGWGLIALIIVLALVILGAVGTVVVWQLGLFGSTEHDKISGKNVTESILNNSTGFKESLQDHNTNNVNRHGSTSMIGEYPSITTMRYRGKINNENLNEDTISAKYSYHDEASEENTKDDTTTLRMQYTGDNTTPYNNHKSNIGETTTPFKANYDRIDTSTIPSEPNYDTSSVRNIEYISEATTPIDNDRSSSKIINIDDVTTPSNINKHISITESIPISDDIITENGGENIIIDHNVQVNHADLKDAMVMVLIGGRNSSGGIHPGNELVGGYGSASTQRCDEFEKFPANFDGFEGNSGAVFISKINAVVSCGYTNMVDMHGKVEPKTESFIFHKSKSVWESAGYPLDKIGLSDGAFTHWWNRIILFGGYGHFGVTPTKSLSVKVFEFSSVEKDLITNTYEVDMEGSSDDDNEEPNYEDDFKFFLVEESQQAVNKGGIVGGCAITLEDHHHHVKFIVTGGINKHQKVTAHSTLFELIMVQNNPRVKHHRKIPSMTYERAKHGCTMTTLNGEDVVIVAGGGDVNNLPIQHVEFIDAKKLNRWRNLGNLNRGRMNSPSIGRVFGKIIVVGGRTLDNDAVDEIDINNKITATDSIEVYDEDISRWRDLENKDGFNTTRLKSARYNHVGVLVPYSWCLTG